MKRFFIIALFSSISSLASGQVTIMDSSPVKEEAVIAQYDSLSNCIPMYHGNDYDYCHLKGQTLIFCGMPYRGYPKMPYKVGDSYYVKDVIHNNLSFGGTVVLQNTKTKATYKEDLGVIGNQCWVVQGHLDKLRKLYVGNEYLFEGQRNDNKVNCLISVVSHQPNREVEYHTVWKCVDIQVKPRNANDDLLLDERSPVVIVFDNARFGQHYCYYEDATGTPRNLIPDVPPLFELIPDNNSQDDERIGMNKSAISGVYGNPDSIGIEIINGHKYLIWSYGDESVVFGEDNTVKEIRKK